MVSHWTTLSVTVLFRQKMQDKDRRPPHHHLHLLLLQRFNQTESNNFTGKLRYKEKHVVCDLQ